MIHILCKEPLYERIGGDNVSSYEITYFDDISMKVFRKEFKVNISKIK